jgi:hypothetical protein
VCVGDVVKIQDSNSVRGQWKVGRVTNALVEDDGRVRRVEVQYKCLPTKETKDTRTNLYDNLKAWEKIDCNCRGKRIV